ncbi:MAG TPA: sialidase family protein [Actinomycetota bacterium]|nr:sialidase family protein [Actinomycetota bacterium]
MRRPALAAAMLLIASLLCASPAAAQTTTPVQVSSDPYTNPESIHRTQVEPDTFAFGDRILSAFMVGRAEGGSSNIGWAFSPDAGATWTSGFLPGLTIFSDPPGTNFRAADPSVAYDSAHGVWLINTLTTSENSPGTAVFVSRSADGVNWETPHLVSDYTSGFGHDKNWIACDNSPGSRFFGNCYVVWTNFQAGGVMEITRSTDGGLTWSEPIRPEGSPTGFGVQPVVQPNGNVVVVALDGLQQSIVSVRSTDGGLSFGSRSRFSEVRIRRPPDYRNSAFPSVEVDGAGRIYAVWQDCRFRNVCLNSGNDTVISTSDDGINWSPVRAIRPAEGGPNPVPAGADRLQPGLAVDPATSGPDARLGLYFFYSDSPCGTFEGCSLNFGFTSSVDGGESWNPAVRLNARSMPFSWLPNTSRGRMTGDYISASVVGNRAVSVFPLAQEPDPDGTLNQAMHATANEFPAQPPDDPPGGPADTGLLGLISNVLTLLFQLLPGI